MHLNFDYYWLPDEFITGDNLESLGDYIFDIGNYITGDHGRCLTNKSEQELINEQISEINKLNPNILYCYGHDTFRLLSNLNKIKTPFKLLTHNSDIGILEKYQKYIDNDKIIKWYGQNNFIKHDKIVSLPIAIARKKYPHGDVNLLSELSHNNTKKYLCYKNFNIETNIIERSSINDITNKNGILMADKCDHKTYMNYLSQSIFAISPPGNGIDCHRIWECLYMKTIPIVKYHFALDQFKDLPILFINGWEEVTPSFLNSKIDMIYRFNHKLEKLHFTFWQKQIYGN